MIVSFDVPKAIEAHSTSRSSSDERPKELIVHTRLLHLQLKCDTYEQELNRLTTKLQRLNSEVAISVFASLSIVVFSKLLQRQFGNAFSVS